MLAHSTNQPLGKDRHDGRGHEKRLDLHVQQTNDAADAVFRVQRGKTLWPVSAA